MLSKPIKQGSKPKTGGPKQWHSPKTKLGVADSYGTGVRNPTAKSKSVFSEVSVGPSKAKKAPRSLA